MPTAPLRPCTTPGCPELVTDGRCSTHTLDAERQRGSAYQRGYDARWRRFRAWYLATHQACAIPGCGQPATDVDHIDGQGPHGRFGFAEVNCRALCHAHHSARTAADQPGGFQQR